MRRAFPHRVSSRWRSEARRRCLLSRRGVGARHDARAAYRTARVRKRQARDAELQMSELTLRLHIWRQTSRKAKGKFVTYTVKGVSTHASFLEMLDILNEQLTERGEE